MFEECKKGATFRQHKSERERESTRVILSKNVDRLQKKSTKVVSIHSLLAPDIELRSGKSRISGVQDGVHRPPRGKDFPEQSKPCAFNIKSSSFDGLNLADEFHYAYLKRLRP